MLNKNKKIMGVVTASLIVSVVGVGAFQGPNEGPGESGFRGFISHLLSGDKAWETVSPNSPEVGEIGLDLTTGDVDSSQIVQNPDGDLLERIEFVQENMNQGQDLASVLLEGNDAGGVVVTNLGTPTANTDAATKEYVDAAWDSSTHVLTTSEYNNVKALNPIDIKITTQTYYWSLWWITGANQKCDLEYPGYTFCDFSYLENNAVYSISDVGPFNKPVDLWWEAFSLWVDVLTVVDELLNVNAMYQWSHSSCASRNSNLDHRGQKAVLKDITTELSKGNDIYSIETKTVEDDQWCGWLTPIACCK